MIRPRQLHRVTLADGVTLLLRPTSAAQALLIDVGDGDGDERAIARRMLGVFPAILGSGALVGAETATGEQVAPWQPAELDAELTIEEKIQVVDALAACCFAGPAVETAVGRGELDPTPSQPTPGPSTD